MLRHRSIASIFFILIFLLILHESKAIELFQSSQSIRARGMGGFYSPIARGTDCLFYNPAALAFENGIDWRIFRLQLGLSTQFASQGGSSPNLSSFNLTNFYGKRLSLFADGNTAVTVPYFGIAGYDEGRLNMSVHNPPYPNAEINFINDYGYILGFAALLNPEVSMGMNFKQIRRWGGTSELAIGTLLGGATSISTLTGAFVNKGVGYGVDLALASRGQGRLSPSYSLVWRDIGTVTFAKTDGVAAPPPISDNLSLGAAFTVDLPGLDITTGVEFAHLTRSSEQFGKKIHLGTELSLPIIDIRAGLGQGYTSYGLGIDLLFLKFDLASFTEEIGVYPGQIPDSRIQLGLTMDLSFDFNFNMLSMDMGKKRKLKRRR